MAREKQLGWPVGARITTVPILSRSCKRVLKSGLSVRYNRREEPKPSCDIHTPSHSPKRILTSHRCIRAEGLADRSRRVQMAIWVIARGMTSPSRYRPPSMLCRVICYGVQSKHWTISLAIQVIRLWRYQRMDGIDIWNLYLNLLSFNHDYL